MKILTFSSMDRSVSYRLIESCKKYGYDLEFYGKDDWFKDFRQFKINLLLQKLKSINDKHVCFTDAHDTWFVSGNLLNKFLTFEKDVVVSGNRDHYPHTDLYDVEKYPDAEDMRFICCSQFVGKRLALIKVLETIRDNWSGNIDQEGWNYCYMKGLIDVEIDHKCKLFMNMTKVDMKEIENGYFKRCKPVAYHFGGPKGDDVNQTNMEICYNNFTKEK